MKENKKKGMTLIEVMIAMLILAIAMFGAVSFFINVFNVNYSYAEFANRIDHAMRYVEQMKLQPANDARTVYGQFANMGGRGYSLYVVGFTNEVENEPYYIIDNKPLNLRKIPLDYRLSASNAYPPESGGNPNNPDNYESSVAGSTTGNMSVFGAGVATNVPVTVRYFWNEADNSTSGTAYFEYDNEKIKALMRNVASNAAFRNSVWITVKPPDIQVPRRESHASGTGAIPENRGTVVPSTRSTYPVTTYTVRTDQTYRAWAALSGTYYTARAVPYSQVPTRSTSGITTNWYPYTITTTFKYEASGPQRGSLFIEIIPTQSFRTTPWSSTYYSQSMATNRILTAATTVGQGRTSFGALPSSRFNTYWTFTFKNEYTEHRRPSTYMITSISTVRTSTTWPISVWPSRTEGYTSAIPAVPAHTILYGGARMYYPQVATLTIDPYITNGANITSTTRISNAFVLRDRKVSRFRMYQYYAISPVTKEEAMRLNSQLQVTPGTVDRIKVLSDYAKSHDGIEEISIPFINQNVDNQKGIAILEEDLNN